jgi:hypothetical protein
VISSDRWEEEIWTRRSVIEQYGVPVEKLYGQTTAQPL